MAHLIPKSIGAIELHAKIASQTRLASGRLRTVVQSAIANEVPSNATQYRLIVLELLLLQTEAMTRLDRLMHCHIAAKPL